MKIFWQLLTIINFYFLTFTKIGRIQVSTPWSFAVYQISSESIGGLRVPSCGHFSTCSKIPLEPSLAGKQKDSDTIVSGRLVRMVLAGPASDIGSQSVCAGGEGKKGLRSLEGSGGGMRRMQAAELGHGDRQLAGRKCIHWGFGPHWWAWVHWQG